MAACLEDEDERVAALAQLFFHELAKKEYKAGLPLAVETALLRLKLVSSLFWFQFFSYTPVCSPPASTAFPPAQAGSSMQGMGAAQSS